MKTFEQVLKTAKVKYKDAIRGRNYQDSLLTLNGEYLKPSEVYDYETVLFRKKMFTSEIALLEDVFGTELLQLEQLEN